MGFCLGRLVKAVCPSGGPLAGCGAAHLWSELGKFE